MLEETDFSLNRAGMIVYSSKTISSSVTQIRITQNYPYKITQSALKLKYKTWDLKSVGRKYKGIASGRGNVARSNRHRNQKQTGLYKTKKFLFSKGNNHGVKTFNHQGNANQYHNVISLLSKNGCYRGDETYVLVRVGKMGSLFISLMGRQVNYYAKQYGGNTNYKD